MASRSDPNSQYAQEVTFTMNQADDFVVLGFAADLGTCSAKTKAGSRCNNFVNLSGRFSNSLPHWLFSALLKTYASDSTMPNPRSSTIQPSILKTRNIQYRKFF